MRHVILASLIVIASAAVGQDSTGVAMPYDSAVAAYERGAYEPALAGFEAIARDHESAALYFNIGNCYYKLNDIPHALLNYERAALLAPGDEDIRANLDLARTLVVDRVNELPGFSLGSAWEEFRGGGGPDRWAVFALFSCVLLFGGLTLFFLSRGIWPRRLGTVFAGIGLVCTLTSLFFANQRHIELSAHDHAIIMSPKVDVISEPRPGSTLLFVLHEGTKVKVLERRGEWCSVRISSGTVGWMPMKDLERI